MFIQQNRVLGSPQVCITSLAMDLTIYPVMVMNSLLSIVHQIDHSQIAFLILYQKSLLGWKVDVIAFII